MRRLIVLFLLASFLPAQDAPRFEVLVIGTIHAPFQFRAARFTPAHVRAALEIARPDVIGVESNPTWFARGEYHDVTYEAQGVAVPFAQARKIPVHGVDFMDIPAWDRMIQQRLRRWKATLEQARLAGTLSVWQFGKIAPQAYEETRRFFTSPDFDFELVNEVEGDAYNLDGERYYFHPEFIDLDRMDRLARRLAKTNGPAGRYFRARIAFARGRTADALRGLEGLRDVKDAPDLYPFPIDHWRMRYRFDQAVRLEAARCLLARGDQRRAAPILAALKREIAPPPPLTRAGAAEPVRLLQERWRLPQGLRLTSERVEGAMRIEMDATRPEGMYYVRQQVAVARGLRHPKELELRVRLRGRKVTNAALTAYVWIAAERRMQEIGRADVAVGAQAAEQSVRFQVPAEHEHAHLYVYFNGEPGARLWIGPARTFLATPAPPVPLDWCARLLAHEFPGVLGSR